MNDDEYEYNQWNTIGEMKIQISDTLKKIITFP